MKMLAHRNCNTSFLLLLNLVALSAIVLITAYTMVFNVSCRRCESVHTIPQMIPSLKKNRAIDYPKPHPKEYPGDSNAEMLLNWMVHNRPRRNFSDSNNVTGYPEYIVPNIVHFIRFDENQLSFVEMLTISAVHLNHRPDKIYIHCSPCQFTGRYWDMVKDIPELEVRPMARPTHIFGKKLSQVWHASDIARLLIMMTYGGIFLDNDCYVVQSLNKFRHYEFAIGWYDNEFLGTQVLVAHRDARFLKLWYETYRNYDGNRWYYNAGELPTTSVLFGDPSLVHRVKVAFGVTNLINLLYHKNSEEWRDFYVIHLLIRHRSKDIIAEFDDTNVLGYERTFGMMARDILKRMNKT